MHIPPTTIIMPKAFRHIKAFTTGFVLKGVKIVNDFYIIVGKVKHSQKANSKPLGAWVIASSNGIANAHCMCLAGNSEVCSHIAAILFAAEYAHSKTKKKNPMHVQMLQLCTFSDELANAHCMCLAGNSEVCS
uniref:Uncharacterized protein LOC114337433 n=1 Tax=Diabrotica virgifera virgifera TaxID=50390 RepID=A0A6P7G3V1_DIAVI